MEKPTQLRRQIMMFSATLILVLTLSSVATLFGQDDDAELRLRATPRVAFAPADILFVGQIRGGPDDNEELYCLEIEWDWGDDTTSEQTLDCDPYEPGVSEIRRRYSVRHTYNYGGRYNVRLHLKQGNDVVMSGQTRIEVRGYNQNLR
tara:strand:+ start:1203 stop:1646 length:444 start_codon:yes stop_codon:yes gene_type:complete